MQNANLAWASGSFACCILHFELREQFMKPEVVLAQFPAVVARGDLDDACPARRLDAGAHCAFDGGAIHPIHDNLEH
jgi:hypothetical protein